MAPVSVELFQNHPNPFNPSTTIGYSVPCLTRVTMCIYSSAGELVRTLVDCNMPAGVQRVTWDGTNNAGAPVASGVYVYRLRVGKIMQSKKMLLLK